MIGLCGASRTGKTTPARNFAEEQGMPFVETGIAAAHKTLGIDPKKELSINDRIGFQESLLSMFDAQFAHAARNAKLWISDRTPIDLAAFMLSDVQRSSLVGQPDVARLVHSYITRCYASANRYFSTIVLVQPGIRLVEGDSGKAPACPAFMEHINLLQLGLLVDTRLACRHFMIPRRFVSLDDRMSSLHSAVSSAIETHQMNMDMQTRTGGLRVH